MEQHHTSHEGPGHTYNFQTLTKVYVGLIFLAALMVGFSQLPLERLPITWLDLHLVKRLLILAVSISMAAIVAGFLMGLKYEKTQLNSVVFFTNFAFLFVFLVLTLADIGTRGVIDPSFNKQINWKSPVKVESDSTQAAPAP